VIANYLVQLGIGGHSIIKSPLITKAMVEKNTRIIEQQQFTQATGTSQGDNQAALSFNCVTDILLVALTNNKLSPTSFLTHDGRCIEQESSAYVDDVTSLHGTIEGIQHEADIISAFCLLFGFELSLHKIKGYRIQWGNAHLPGDNLVTIHSKGWSPFHLTLENDGAFKTLGMTIDANTSFHTQFQITQQRARSCVHLILKAPISANSKMLAIKVSLIPQLTYAARYAAWTLQQYHVIDKILEHAYRTITHCMASHPTALLYMSIADGGLGLTRFSLECNIGKLRLLTRMDQSSQYRRAIAQSLLGRGARAQGAVIPIGHGALINTPMQVYWVTSLLQELHERNLFMHIHGRRALENIYHWNIIPPTGHKLATQCTNPDIGISTQDENSHEVIAIPLRTAQVWEITTSTGTRIKEIISYSGNNIDFMEWCSPGRAAVGLTLTLATNNNPISPYPIGAHGTHRECQEDFFPPHCEMRLLILSAEKHDQHTLKITSKVTCIKIKTPLPLRSYSPPTHICDLLHLAGNNAQMIFTDGSFDRTTTPSRGGGAVIFKMNQTTYNCIKIVKDTDITSVFDIEMAALAIARVAATTAPPNCDIYSDSQASVNIMKSINKGDFQKKPLQHIFNQRHLYSDHGCKWVKSHVEKRKADRSTWTEEEIGNFIADNMAGHEQDSQIAGPPVIITIIQPITILTTMVIKLSTIINMFAQQNSFSIRSATQCFTGMVKDLHIQSLTTTYLKKRDEYRNQRNPELPDTPYWVTHCPQHLIHTNRTSGLVRENSLRSRIIYDKSWTTGNQYKYGATATPEPCPCCGREIETQAHIIFSCSNSIMVATRTAATMTIHQLTQKQKEKYPPLSPIIDYLLEHSTNRASTELWTGLWSTQLLTTIDDKLKGRPYDGKYTLETVLKLTRLYTDACKELYISRHSIITKPAVTVSEAHTERAPTKINEYFEGDNKKKVKKKDTAKGDTTATNKSKTEAITGTYTINIPAHTTTTGVATTITESEILPTTPEHTPHTNNCLSTRTPAVPDTAVAPQSLPTISNEYNLQEANRLFAPQSIPTTALQNLCTSSTLPQHPQEANRLAAEQLVRTIYDNYLIRPNLLKRTASPPTPCAMTDKKKKVQASRTRKRDRVPPLSWNDLPVVQESTLPQLPPNHPPDISPIPKRTKTASTVDSHNQRTAHSNPDNAYLSSHVLLMTTQPLMEVAAPSPPVIDPLPREGVG
jgi:ribonuclease HI